MTDWKTVAAAAGLGLAQGLAPLSPAGAQEGGGDGAGVTTLDAITVTATRTERPAIEVPASVSVVERAEIQRAQPQSLDDVVQDVPGIQMTGGPRNIAEQPNIRGLGDERVVIRMDGVRKNFQAGHKGRTFMDPSLLKRVDVLRGPSSMLYGSGALGGVINMETIDAGDMLAPGETVGGRVSTGFQTNNDMRRVGLTAYARPLDGVSFLVNGTRSSSGSYKDGNGDDIPYSGDSVRSALGKASIERYGHELDLSLNHYNDEHDIPTAANNASNIVAGRVTRERSGSLRYGYEGGDGLIDLDAVTYVNDTFIREVVKSSGRHDVTELETVGLDVSNTADLGLGEDVALALTGGFEVYRDSQVGRRNGAPRQQYPEAEQLIEGYFAQAEFTLWDDLTVTPGLRYDTYDQEARGQQDVSDSQLSRKLAVAYRPADWLRLFGSYSEAFRAPSLTELYVRGTHFVFNTFVPNPDLKPERAKNLEGGAALSFDDAFVPDDALRLKATAFRNDVDDLIESTVQGGIFGTTTNNNVPEARIRGAELEAAYETERYFARLGATTLRGDDLTNNEPLADIPEDKVTLTGGMRWPRTGITAGWRAALYFGQERVPAGTTPRTGRKAVHDLFVSYVPSDADLAGLRVDFGIDNIFDRDFQKFGSVLPEVGRNVKLSASYRF